MASSTSPTSSATWLIPSARAMTGTLPPFERRHDPRVPGDRADEDRLARHRRAGEDHAGPQLGAVTDRRAVADHERALQPRVLADLDVGPDPDRRLDHGDSVERRA